MRPGLSARGGPRSRGGSASHRRAVVAVVLAVVVGLLPLTAAAQTDHRWWWVWFRVNQVDAVNLTCDYGARIGLQEIGTSGITRLRVQFRKKFWRSSLPYSYGAWQWSNYFPDDARSFYENRFYAWKQVQSTQVRYLEAKMVWEIPSFWNPDKVEKAVVAWCDGGSFQGGS